MCSQLRNISKVLITLLIIIIPNFSIAFEDSNNTCETATSLVFNDSQNGLLNVTDDVEDYYKFGADSPGQLTLDFNNSFSTSTQLYLAIKQGNCSNFTILWQGPIYEGFDGTLATIDIISAGDIYFQLIITSGIENTDYNYKFTTSFQGDPTYVDPYLYVEPTSLVFYAVEGGPNPDIQTFKIRNLETGSPTLEWSITVNSNWLNVYPTNGTNDNQDIFVEVDINGLAIGVYSTDITVSSANADNGPVIVSVTLNIRCSTPGDPILTSPMIGETVPLFVTNLSWQSGSDFTGSHLQVADNYNFNNPIDFYFETSYGEIEVPSNKIYYWRVRNENECGWGGWSSKWWFIACDDYQSPPNLIQPSDGSDNQPLNLQLSWSEVEGALQYAIEGKIGEFSDPDDWRRDFVYFTGNTYYDLTGLEPNTKYSWKVVAETECSWMNYSEPSSFVTGTDTNELPPPPALVSPESHEQNVPIKDAEFDWEDVYVPYIISYQIQIDDDQGFSSPIVDTYPNSSYYHTSQLNYGTNYFWRVRTINFETGTEGLWDDSEVRGFSTEGVTLNVPFYYQGGYSWCYLASLSMLLDYYGQRIKMWDIALDIGLDANTGASIEEIRKWMEDGHSEIDLEDEKYVFLENAIEKMKQTLQQEKPLIVVGTSEDVHHAIAITGCEGINDEDVVYINDPALSKTGINENRTAHLSITWNDLKSWLNNKWGFYDCYLMWPKNNLSENSHNYSISMPILSLSAISTLDCRQGMPSLVIHQWDGTMPLGYKYHYTDACETFEPDPDYGYKFKNGDILRINPVICNNTNPVIDDNIGLLVSLYVAETNDLVDIIYDDNTLTFSDNSLHEIEIPNYELGQLENGEYEIRIQIINDGNTEDEVMIGFRVNEPESFTAYCPVAIEMIDQSGNRTGIDISDIPNTVYVERDFDQDGESDSRIVFLAGTPDIYSISVYPKEYASNEDEYTIVYNGGGINDTICENVKISDIPIRGYRFSTLDTGSINGLVSVNSISFLGIPVDLYDGDGNAIASAITNETGWYEFAALDNGLYSVSIATPLGYQCGEDTKEIEVKGLPHEVNFELTQLEIPLSQRGRGYWMHQVNALLSGKGNPHETYENMCEYMELIRTHFNEHSFNAVNVFEVALDTDCNGNLEALRTTISPRSKASMIDKAKAHLTALLLNMVSGKIAQWAYISEDDATLSQAITYCNLLITNGDETDDEIAKDIAEMINEGELVPTGLINASTPDYSYRQIEEVIPTQFGLSQNHPNPFNPTTEINLSLPVASDWKITIYNISGQKVEQFSGNSEAGVVTVKWTAPRQASGIYLYKAEAGAFSDTKKMLLLK